MNLGQGGVYLANLLLPYDIVALQVAKINAHISFFGHLYCCLCWLGKMTCHSFQRSEIWQRGVRQMILFFTGPGHRGQDKACRAWRVPQGSAITPCTRDLLSMSPRRFRLFNPLPLLPHPRLGSMALVVVLNAVRSSETDIAGVKNTFPSLPSMEPLLREHAFPSAITSFQWGMPDWQRAADSCD